MIFLHPSIDPSIFSFGPFELRWYSLAYIIGFILGLYFIKKINVKKINKLKNKTIDDFFIWSILGVIIGGRLGYITFYQTYTIFNNPIEILFIWQGGMSFHGGLIGIITSIYIYSKIFKISFFQLSDLISIAAPIGLFFGRIANFINVELYGRITDFPVAIIYPTIDNYPRHPSQLYEAFLEGLIIFLILYYYNKNSKNKNFGFTSGLFLILYGIFRTLVEFLREPDIHMGLFYGLISMGQILSIPLIILGIFICINKNKHE
tara:strand:+ start:4329 stop:5114 length:786 start_codon:yes stop_codon:yes gene_type:complete